MRKIRAEVTKTLFKFKVGNLVLKVERIVEEGVTASFAYLTAGERAFFTDLELADQEIERLRKDLKAMEKIAQERSWMP